MSEPPPRGPFAGFAPARRRSLGWTLAAGWVAAALPMLEFERRMMRTGGPGIVPFELAGSSERAADIMDRWGGEGRRAARRSLVVDYPFLIGYAPLLALGCERAGREFDRRRFRPAAGVGPALAWGQLAAGGFDAIENGALLGVLAGGGDDFLPRLARACSLTKLALMSVGVAYTATGLIAERRAPS